uniref:uncharacterized protein LOC120346589 n=1 Tax=Styela clava TaxID=7725 RepID=UPI00193979F1|nr:uncharacterized protein LOC120346589 [Styela clava]
MATSTPPVNVYNIHPDLTAIKNALPTYPIDGVSEEVQRALERRMREPSRPPPVPRRQEPIEQPRRNPARTTRTTDKPWLRDAPRRGKEKQAARGNFTSQRSEPRALNEGTRPTSSRQQPPVGRETTPSNSEEALQIAEREGSSYDFLANANIFAPLGLYTTPTNGQSLAVCYLCKAPGHLSKNCVVKAILWLSDKVLAKNDGGQWGIKERARPLPDHTSTNTLDTTPSPTRPGRGGKRYRELAGLSANATLSQLPEMKTYKNIMKTLNNFNLPLFTLFGEFDQESSNFSDIFGDKLMYLVDQNTGAAYLADTGSIPNLMTIETAKRAYPQSWATRKNLNMKLRGIGGTSEVDSLITINIEGTQIPFATGKGVPLNIVGFAWIERVMALKSVTTELENPSSHLSDLVMAVDLSGSDDPQVDLWEPRYNEILGIPNLNGFPLSVRNRGKYFNYDVKGQGSNKLNRATINREGERVGVSGQTQEVDASERTQENPKLEPKQNGGSQDPCLGNFSDLSTAAKSPVISVPDERMKWVNKTLVGDYVLKEGSAEAVRTELRLLSAEAVALARERYVSPDENDKENTIITEEEWKVVYEPYSKTLGDLRGNLKKPQALKYPCKVELKDPNINHLFQDHII